MAVQNEISVVKTHFSILPLFYNVLCFVNSANSAHARFIKCVVRFIYLNVGILERRILEWMKNCVFYVTHRFTLERQRLKHVIHDPLSAQNRLVLLAENVSETGK